MDKYHKSKFYLLFNQINIFPSLENKKLGQILVDFLRCQKCDAVMMCDATMMGVTP
jgi:hypothetical protein